MEVAARVSTSLSMAVVICQSYRHEYVCPEHLLYAFLKQESPCEALTWCNANPDDVKKELEEWFAEQEKIPGNGYYDPDFSVQFKQIQQTAYLIAMGAERQIIDIPHFFQAIFQLSESRACYILEKAINGEQAEFMEMLVTSFDLNDEDENDMDDQELPGNEMQDEERVQAWKTLVTCITDIVDQHNPLIGREMELDRTIQVLCRKEKNNPLHVGDPGVGKTSLIYGLAQRINDKQVPERLQNCRIYQMDMGQMLAGTQFRGDFEKRIKMVMDGVRKEGNAIVYLDEIHNIIGAGANADGGPDASNILKPYLEQGDIRFIGSTTYEEYKRKFARSGALVRRFQMISIDEPSVDEAIGILKGLQKKYEQFHHVTYRHEAIEYAVKASAKYISDRFLPDKAIDLIDEAGAYLELHPNNRSRQYVTIDLINQVLMKVCKIDAAVMKSNDQTELKSLSKRIADQVYGQDEAVKLVSEAVEMSKAGLLDDNKPMASLLFVGPTGVGKTELARVLARELGVELVRFDMSEYTDKTAINKLIGSSAGYVGYEEGGLLTDAIRKTPNCVLLLDEIEKAHSDIYNILLQVMDYARLTDNHGQKADFRNVIVIMTSNAGAQYASQANIGFQGHVSRGDAMMKQVKKTFKPEFINRLSATVVFHDMDRKMAQLILGKKLAQLQQKLRAKKVEMRVSKEAETKLLEWGFTPEYGAREMDRVISQRLKPLFMREILYGKLKNGGKAEVIVKDDELKLK